MHSYMHLSFSIDKRRNIYIAGSTQQGPQGLGGNPGLQQGLIQGGQAPSPGVDSQVSPPINCIQEMWCWFHCPHVCSSYRHHLDTWEILLTYQLVCACLCMPIYVPINYILHPCIHVGPTPCLSVTVHPYYMCCITVFGRKFIGIAIGGTYSFQ